MVDPTIGDGSWMAKPGGWPLQFWRSSCQVHLWTGGKSGFLSLGFYQMNVANRGVFVASCRDCGVCLCRIHPVGSFSILAMLLKFQQQVGVTCRCDLQLWRARSTANSPEVPGTSVTADEQPSTLQLAYGMVVANISCFCIASCPAGQGSVIMTTQIWSPLTAAKAHMETHGKPHPCSSVLTFIYPLFGWTFCWHMSSLCHGTILWLLLWL